MATPTNLNTVNLKIKKAVRIISFKNRDHHTDPLFKELEILPLDKSIELKKCQIYVEVEKWISSRKSS